jgi:ribose/xylose/arabinose/galactoside ABC-type transport system permease subunit
MIAASRGALSPFAIWLVLAAMLLAAGVVSSAFRDPVYLVNMLRQAAPVGIAAVGVTLVMIAGGVDLSVGAIISLAAVICAVQMGGSAANMPFAVAVTLLLSAAIGLANGLLVALTRVSPFILTLGSALAVYGLAQVYSGGTARGVVAPGFREFFNQRLGGVLPVLALSFVLLALLVEAALRTTVFGRRLYLVGANRRAARIAGLPVARTTIIAYVLSGLFAGLGGLALLARSGVSSTYAGQGYEFDALAAIVLGGTTFEGGRGNAVGTVAGVLVLFAAFNLVNVVGLNYNTQLMVKGLIIIAASAAYALLERER